MGSQEVLRETVDILLKYSLCDHCLGRLYAKMGVEMRNEERGFALKRMVAMHLDDILKGRSDEERKNIIFTLARNAGEPFTRIYSKIYGVSVGVEKCYICGGVLSRSLYERLAREIAGRLAELDATSFLVGVSLEEEVSKKELEVASALRFGFSESIKNEIKREVGKIVSALTGLKPSFTNPDVTAIISFPGLEIRYEINPVYIKGSYLKLGRNISHTPWVTREGLRKYPLSIQEYVENRLKPVFKSERVLIHAAGREDVDARMVGSGRPLVIEVVKPARRRVSVSELNSILNNGIVSVSVEGFAGAKDVELVKEVVGRKAKVYKILVLAGREIGGSELIRLEEFFRDRLILQRTPTRILRRKKDVLRKRRVFAVKATSIAPRVFEALVLCESGLYVKELVHCDGGRTDPCFSSVLGVEAIPLELDVLGFVERLD
ncbi:tRNA pseudouridine(54/55) synthase Pus10 [Thermogladius sp. 4427co]|uniref:tRNA pseudouridine(54/55) synthase Pus10 n=1 Tax=Thermogladius sp. 4427co TaxID=3450718 RepID=UPI003F7B11FD